MSARSALRSAFYVAAAAAHLGLALVEHFAQRYAPTPGYQPASDASWDWCHEHDAYNEECGGPHDDWDQCECVCVDCVSGRHCDRASCAQPPDTSPAYCSAGDRPAADDADPLLAPAAGQLATDARYEAGVAPRHLAADAEAPVSAARSPQTSLLKPGGSEERPESSSQDSGRPTSELLLGAADVITQLIAGDADDVRWYQRDWDSTAFIAELHARAAMFRHIEE